MHVVWHGKDCRPTAATANKMHFTYERSKWQIVKLVKNIKAKYEELVALLEVCHRAFILETFVQL